MDTSNNDRGFCLPALSWGSIIGGAIAATAISLLLLTLGAGIGLASASPWHNNHSLTTFSICTAIWLIVMQWVSAGFGGYLAGRLRSKWIGVHTDEAFFRDTAHGFLAWALATIVTTLVIASAASSVMGSVMKPVSAVASGAAAGATHAASMPANAKADSNIYFVDRLFRIDKVPNASSGAAHTEAAGILTNDLATGDVTEDDKGYLTQLVSSQTGLNKADAAQRVEDTLTQIKTAKEQAKQAAEDARKVSEKISFYTFFSLLIGAFIASVAGALGGKQRDEY